MAGSPWRSNVAPVFVLVLWLSCLVVGGLGFALPYARPQPRHEPAPVLAQRIEIQLAPGDSQPVTVETPPSDPDTLAAPPEAPSIAVPSLPTPIAISQPTHAIAFPVPVEPASTVPQSDPAEVTTASRAALPPSPGTPPVAQSLTFGRGEGRQPSPPYPPQAMREGQEGTVQVRLMVGEDGRVNYAEASRPSPWRLLNEAAVRTVRQRWRFQSGPPRAYEVAIHFQLEN